MVTNDIYVRFVDDEVVHHNLVRDVQRGQLRTDRSRIKCR